VLRMDDVKVVLPPVPRTNNFTVAGFFACGREIMKQVDGLGRDLEDIAKIRLHLWFYLCPSLCGLLLQLLVAQNAILIVHSGGRLSFSIRVMVKIPCSLWTPVMRAGFVFLSMRWK